MKKLHPRTMVCEKAAIALSTAISTIAVKHDLTMAEILCILARELASMGGMAVKYEREEASAKDPQA